MKKIFFNENTIVAFGAGKSFTFLGEHDIKYFTDELFSPIMADPDNDEDFIDNNDPDAEWKDCNGCGVGMTNAMVESGVGYIEDCNGERSVSTMYLKDVQQDSQEWEAIFEADGFEAEQAQMYLRNELAIDNVNELAGYINANRNWHFVVADIIKMNNWDDLTDSDYDVCEDIEGNRVTMTDSGDAIVVDAE